MLQIGLCAAWAAAASAQQPGPGVSDMYRAQPEGALSGATIFVSPGHGWYLGDDKQWHTQRGVTNGMVEDFSNAEMGLQYLVPYLWNAGANVVTMRERDFQTNMVIVEAAAGSAGYRQKGAWTEERGVGAYGGTHRVATTLDRKGLKPSDRDSKLAIATFTPEIPEDGYYGVYAWYSDAAKGKTATDAEFIIQHTGGTTIWRQDENRDGETWKYMGTYWFAKGTNEGQGSVKVVNATSKAGQNIVVDAIRFGGGVGASGNPRWEESGMHYAEFMGYDPSGDSRGWNTVRAMPYYTQWEAEPWEKGKSIYVAWHTNAFNGKTRGLSSFIYSPDEYSTDVTRFTGIPGGDVLGKIVHEEIGAEIHAAYDPQWPVRGIVCRWLGETNPTCNSKMPAALFETGFHDNPDDAAYILDPTFRRTTARAIYHGIVKFYVGNMKGFDNPTMIPEPPTHLRVLDKGNRVALAWDTPPSDAGDGVLGSKATGYRVYRSRNGKGFDNGFATSVANVEINVAPGETWYFRVTATNSGGESLPGETLAVRTGVAGPKLLIVNGFDRLDSGLNLLQPDGAQRGILSKMNSFDYSIQHAQALAEAGYGFSSSSNDAVVDGELALNGFDAAIWILGQESKGSATFDARERFVVGQYLTGGGAMFVSGSDLGFDLAETDAKFLQSLGCNFVETDSGVRTAEPVAGGIFADMTPITFGSAVRAVYPVQTPDVLAPQGQAQAALRYANSDRAAAIQTSSPARVVAFGFPFESIEDPAQRAEAIGCAVRFLAESEKKVAENAK